MKVVVKKRANPGVQLLRIETEFIKLESAMKLANIIPSGGAAKTEIQEGFVKVNGEVCTMRGKKLRPGDQFEYEGDAFLICSHEAE
jgi:ribosome-associated protein